MLTIDSPPKGRRDDGVEPTTPPVGRQRPRAVVIGSGFGGLAAAIRLGARGYAVTVVERLDRLGGRAAVYRENGFTFDAGPTIITAPFLLDELWALCGERREDHVPLVEMDPYYRLRFDDGETFDVFGDEARMRAEVARIAPDDLAGYDRFMRVSAEMYRCGFEGLSEKPFNTFWDMAEVVPDLARLRADRSVFGLAKRCMKSDRLRLAYSFHPLFVGGNPLTATSFYSMVSELERRSGVMFAMGGTGALVAGMAALLDKLGADVRTRAHVDEILVKDGAAVGVRLESGETLPAEVVVSNADSATTYKRMMPNVQRRVWTDRKLDRAAYSMGLFVWYFGVKRRYDDVPHHTIVLGPRYEALLRDIFDRKRLAEDFSLYLHRPTATDPSLAPQGCDSFYALSPVPNLQSGDDWSAIAEDYRAKVMRRLSDTVLPGLENEIVTSRVVTPLHFRDDLASEHGAAFGLSPNLLQMAWFRPHNRSEEVKNLFLVGAGTHPGAGVPGVLCSAKVVDKVAPDVSAFT